MVRVLLIGLLAVIGVTLAVLLLTEAGAVVNRLIALAILAAVVGCGWLWRRRAAR